MIDPSAKRFVETTSASQHGQPKATNSELHSLSLAAKTALHSPPSQHSLHVLGKCYPPRTFVTILHYPNHTACRSDPKVKRAMDCVSLLAPPTHQTQSYPRKWWL